MADPPKTPVDRPRAVARWVLATIYLTAGALHILIPDPFVRITPAWVGFPDEVVAFTGMAEIAGAIALMTPRFRRLAGAGLAAYALCVWPANAKHAIDDLTSGTGLPLLYHVPRMLAQPLIIWWALWAGEATNWPFRKKSG